jgi:release factor glutamine methyltransferase
MRLSEIKFHFQTELSDLYSKSEIEELFAIFCEHFLNLNKIGLRNSFENGLSAIDSEKFLNSVSELKTGKPFQQILGETEFYGMKFFVNEHVLIPRPETEELLELAINKIKGKIKNNQDLNIGLREPQPDNQKSETNKHFRILDIGTGSGIIPIVLKKYFPNAEVSAIDISDRALEVAKRNAEFHKTEIHFINQDYLNEDLDGIYDVIISNPPYIGTDENAEIEDSVKGFEPNLALFSPTSDALVFYRKIAEDCKNHLSENGMLFLEINQKLGPETLGLYDYILSEGYLLKDISGNDRMIFGRK